MFQINSANDRSYSCYDTYSCSQVLQPGYWYTITGLGFKRSAPSCPELTPYSLTACVLQPESKKTLIKGSKGYLSSTLQAWCVFTCNQKAVLMSSGRVYEISPSLQTHLRGPACSRSSLWKGQVVFILLVSLLKFGVAARSDGKLRLLPLLKTHSFYCD